MTTAVRDRESSLLLHIRPNPVADHIWISSDEPLLELQVVGADGTLRRSVPGMGQRGTTEVSVEDLVPAAYLLRARTMSGVKTTRFVKL